MNRILTTLGDFVKLGFFAATIIFVLIVANLFYRSEEIVNAESPQTVRLARWNEQPKILGAKRGNPWINVLDGKEILTDFSGSSELQASFENGDNRSLSIATADFDEDGMPDIVIGYSNDKSGAASFMRGNVDAIYPNAPEAKLRKARGEFTNASFLSPARLFGLSVKADFLVAGDFDADGHFDIATAARNENSIYFLRGNGKGEFDFAKRVELAGNVTAFLADDFNRRDGLNDLIVAVQTGQKGQLLIFEHPYGAMKASPEMFTFAAPITSLAINLIEGNAYFDLAITTGNEFFILRGRDRQLMIDESGKQADAMQFTRQSFDFQIDALAIGDFIQI